MQSSRTFLLCLAVCLAASKTTVLGQGVHQGPKAKFKTERITAATPGHSAPIEVGIRGWKNLFLVVTDAGDGNSYDWADWMEPRLIGPEGELRLTELKWKSAQAAWGKVRVNKNVAGKALRVAGKPVSFGIGTHAQSIIHYKLPPGYERFVARGGIDNGGSDQKKNSSVVFSIYKQRPKHLGAPPPPPITETSVPVGKFVLPDDLELTVWAQSPLFNNPTNIDIDAAGRIWVAEGMNYRSSKKRPKGDRIVVVEDSDGDGKADTSHVFVQDKNLIAPLGIAVIGNKIVVSQPPDLLVYTDVDGDLRFDPAVDHMEKLLSGFQGRNHDHSLHSVTVGPDGLWYFNHGNTGSTFTDHSGKTFRIGSHYSNQQVSGLKSDDGYVWVGGTAFRMRADGSQVEVIGHNFRNSYEQCVTSFGDVFQNDNDDPPNCRTSWLMEYGNAGYASNNGKRNWRADLRPGQSTQIAHWRQEDPGSMPAGDIYGGGAPTGIVYYENGILGAKYAGMLLSCESAKNIVFGYHPQPQGAGFSLDRFAFLTSNPEKVYAGADFKRGRGALQTLFRPSDVAVGPDGAVYVADWFDDRVGGHATHDDLGSGTIYRIAPKGAKLQIPVFDLATIEGQITALKSPAVNVRALGLEALRKAGEKALPAVLALLSDPDGFIRARAVWILPYLGAKGVLACEALLSAADPQMRIVAFRALRRTSATAERYAESLAEDPAPSVRREAALALRGASPEKHSRALEHLAKGYDGVDRWYLEALGTASAGHEEELYTAFEQSFGGDSTQWSEAFARIAWRLHASNSLPQILARAKNQSLTLAARKLAIDTLAFMPTREAGEAVLAIAGHGPSDTRGYATWWLRHRHNNDWRSYDLVAKLPRKATRVTRVTTNPATAIKSRARTSLPPRDQILKLKGVAQRGEKLFTGRATCFVCHQIKGKGGTIGPDLSDAAQKFSGDILLKAMIEPSADISLGFEATEITKRDQTVVTGYILGEGDPVLIRDLAGNQHAIDAKDIVSRKKLQRSLMPEASALGLTAADLADLIAYLRSHE